MRMKRNNNKDKSQKWVVSHGRRKERSPFLSSPTTEEISGRSRTNNQQTPQYLPRNHLQNCVRCHHSEFNIGLQSLDISSDDRLCTNEPSAHAFPSCAFHSSQGGRPRGEQQQLSNVIYEEGIDPNIKSKREKMGLFRNLRRRFSSFKKPDNTDFNGHSRSIDDYEPPHNFSSSSSSSANTTPNLVSARLKERNRKDPVRSMHCSGPVPNGCDSVNSSLQKFISPKYNSDWHSNTNHPASESGKEKWGCVSKNISDLHYSDSSMQCEDSAFEDTVSESTDITCSHREKGSDKPSAPEPVYELADCVEYDPVKDQTKIWSPKVWSLTQELFRLSKFGWYWGPITRNEAEDKLTNQPDGAFLVRDSSDERYLLSLSFRSYGVTLHTRIEHCNGMFSFYAQPDSEGYPSIVDLIEHSMNDSQTGIFYYSRSRSPGAPQFPVRLTKPVSRFTQVRSLQYLCRFVIRQYTRYDHIQQLPLPSTLKGWIEENQY